MTLDFTVQLHNYVKNLDLGMLIKVGFLESEDSISMYALPGGETIREFFDGTKDKRLGYEFQIKTKGQGDGQEKAITVLDKIAKALENANIPSENESYDFGKIIVSSEPFMANVTPPHFYFSLTIVAELTTYNERNDKE